MPSFWQNKPYISISVRIQIVRTFFVLQLYKNNHTSVWCNTALLYNFKSHSFHHFILIKGCVHTPMGVVLYFLLNSCAIEYCNNKFHWCLFKKHKIIYKLHLILHIKPQTKNKKERNFDFRLTFITISK